MISFGQWVLGLVERTFIWGEQMLFWFHVTPSTSKLTSGHCLNVLPPGQGHPPFYQHKIYSVRWATCAGFEQYGVASHRQLTWSLYCEVFLPYTSMSSIWWHYTSSNLNETSDRCSELRYCRRVCISASVLKVKVDCYLYKMVVIALPILSVIWLDDILYRCSGPRYLERACMLTVSVWKSNTETFGKVIINHANEERCVVYNIF